MTFAHLVDTPEYRAKNPNGRVPTIQDGDFVLWESILEHARRDFEKRLQVVDDQLQATRYICGDRFTYGDIPLAIRVHRWHVLGLATDSFPSINRWYREIIARPAFNVWTADPANHLEG